MSNFPKSDFFTIGPVTLSYIDGLFEAQKKQSGDGENYNCNIIFNEQQRAYIQQWVDYIGQQAFPNEWNVPNRVKRPIRPTEEKPGYATRFPGHFFCSVKSNFAPQVADANRQKVLANMADPNRTDGQKIFYGGVQAYVSINVWSYRHPTGGPSVSIGIQAVMKYADAEPLVESGGVNLDEVFAGVQAPAANATPPQMGGAAPPPVAVGGQPAAAPAQAPAAPAQAPAAPAQAPAAPAQAPAAPPAFNPGAPQGAPAGAPPGQPPAFTG